MSTNEIGLKPCIYYHQVTYPSELRRVKVDDYWWHIECNCGARGPRGDDGDVAAGRWNEREDEDLL